MKNRLLVPLAALSLAGSVVVSATAASATSKSHGSHAASTHRRAVKLAEGVRPVPVAAIPGARAVSPKIDATLQTIAAAPNRASVLKSGVPVAKDGRIDVTVTGSKAAAAAAAVGAQIGSSAGDQTDVRIAPSALSALAAQSGVSRVARTNFALPQSGVTSEGVTSSGASQWQAAAPALGNAGTGVNVAIVDAGFGSLQSEIAAGNLPADKVVYNKALPADANSPDNNPANMDHCLDTGSTFDPSADQNTDHGTAVAEIVHQMAPNAVLYLYCVQSSTQFIQAAGQIAANTNVAPNTGKIKVASSSLGFLGEARGDGFGGPNTTEGAVQAARRAGVLWVQSAGNYGQDHWSGLLNGPRSSDGYLDLDTVDSQNIADATSLDPGGQGDVVVTWDQWPVTKTRVSVHVLEWNSTQNPNVDQPINSYIDADYDLNTSRLSANSSPVLDVHLENSADPNVNPKDYHVYYVFLQVLDTTGAVRYDIDYTNDLYPNYLASTCVAPDPTCPVAAHNAAAQTHGAGGSLTTPATSPYVLAVGAAYAGHSSDNEANDPVKKNALEPFSSRGPTIDGRAKPDLVAYDGVSSNIADVESTQFDPTTGSELPSTLGFYGTSAAAPHVAGAAALVAAANPSMDASQLEAFLEAPGNNAGTVSPANNTSGHGLLQLGAADPTKVVPSNGSRYHLFAQAQRIADTRTGLGVTKGSMGAGRELTVPVPSTGADAVPADAVSVVVSVSGTAAKGGTYLSIYPRTWPGNSTLNLAASDPNSSVTSIVRIDPATHTFKLRNAAAQTDAIITLLGYFGAESETAAAGEGYVALTPSRVLDTRNAIGGPTRKLVANQTVTVNTTGAGVPSTAQVVAVTIQALDQTASGQLTAFPTANPPVSSVDYTKYPRANLVLVPVVNGKFTLQNKYATTDALVDVSGYFSSAATARFVTMDSPIRFVDTRTGNGGRYAPMSSNMAITEDGGGIYGVPYNASALWVGMTAIASAPGFASIYPAGQSFPHASNLYYTTLRSVPDSAIATLSTSTATTPPQVSTVVRSGTINLLQDNYGYFYTPGVAGPSRR